MQHKQSQIYIRKSEFNAYKYIVALHDKESGALICEWEVPDCNVAHKLRNTLLHPHIQLL